MTTLERFRVSMAASRAAGRSFDWAWVAARREVGGQDWVAALEDTRDAWHAAYVGAPAPAAVTALRAVAHDDEREAFDEDSRGPCDRCGAAIPSTRRRQSIYCSHECQRAVHRVSAAA